jgi:DNA transformation protein
MAVSSSFIAFASELFAPFGDIVVKKMFGGAGVYCDGLFFALLAEDEIFLKVDEGNRAEFERAGLAPFTFEMKDGSSATMSYYAAPGDFYDDAEVMRRWSSLALDAARRAAKFRKKAPKKAAPKKSRAKRAQIPGERRRAR